MNEVIDIRLLIIPIPYGELKHSGRATIFAPFSAASRINFVHFKTLSVLQAETAN